MHWHANDAGGVPRLADADLYGATLDEIAGCVLAYPSYPIDVPDTVDTRLAHCMTLRARHRLELGPLDVATVNLVLWDTTTADLAPLERATPLLNTVRRIASAHDATPAQVALAWLLAKPNVVAIPGARSVEQLRHNVAAADLELDDEEVEELTAESDAFEPLACMRESDRSSASEFVCARRVTRNGARCWAVGARRGGWAQGRRAMRARVLRRLRMARPVVGRCRGRLRSRTVE